jgi:putative DNA primase/helicase
MSNLDAALKLAAAGLPVFPVNPETKKPFVRFTSAATNLERGVRYYWQRYADALVAINLAGCDLVVIDLDRGHADGADGIVTFGELLDRHGEIPPCPAVRTPRGGAHLYFRQSPGRKPIGNNSGHIGPGIDHRGYHGFAFAPGTVTMTGEFYEAIGGAPDLCASFMAGAIPEIPLWLIELIESGPETHAREPISLEPASEARFRKYALGALQGEASALANTGVGRRNSRLNYSAHRLGSICARGWLSEQEVWDALQVACERNGYIGSDDRSDGPKAFHATFHSALNAGLRKPAADPRERLSDDISNMIDLKVKGSK